MESKLFSQADGPEVDLSCPSQDLERARDGPFEEFDRIPIYVEEDPRVADRWLAEFESSVAALAELEELDLWPTN